ncbi:MAG: hypothetical protein JWO67_1058 [Streptosporangiaceae bacterium]|nr:hypothetical protein [Streptosporangiaceae bacterium]
MAERIQLRRTRGWRLPPNTTVVSRPSRYGNPYRVGAPGVPDNATAVALLRRHLELSAMGPALPSMELVPGLGIPVFPDVDTIRRELAGRNLACWCGASDPCHVDVLLPIANPEDLNA